MYTAAQHTNKHADDDVHDLNTDSTKAGLHYCYPGGGHSSVNCDVIDQAKGEKRVKGEKRAP